MKTSEYIRKIRFLLHDQDGKVWSDTELETLLTEAAKQYSEDSQFYRGRKAIITDKNGLMEMPENYIGYLAGWNDQGEPIEQVGINELEHEIDDYTDAEGKARYVYEDLNSRGKIRLCPNPYKEQTVTTHYPYYPYGVVKMCRRGIPVKTEGYGLPVKISRYRVSGEVFYIRSEIASQIRDHLAVIYQVMYRAYLTDGDFQDVGKAEMYRGLYRQRINGLEQIRQKGVTRGRTARFY